MNGSFAMNLVIFLLMQLLAQLAMKYGSAGAGGLRSRRWWLGFILANAVGAPSILFLKELYRAVPANPNLVATIAMAGTFLLSQAGMIILFRSRPTAAQWAGIAMIAIGGIMACLGG